MTVRPEHGLEIGLVEGLDGLEALRPAWRALWTQSGATPFQAPACLIPWARHHAPDRVAAVTVREAGELVGLLPVFDWQGVLLFAGTGPTDYNDGVFAPGRVDACEAAMDAACRLAVSRGCVSLDLHQLRPESLLLAAPAPQGWSAALEDGEVCPVAPLVGEDGLGGLAAGWPRKVRYNQKRCGAAGGVFELATVETVQVFWDALATLHAKRWAALGEPGVLGDPLMAAFLADALPELMSDDLLRMGAIRIEGAFAAVLCALRGPQAWCFYLTGFDPDLQAVSPGTTLIAAMFTAAAAEGAREVQFLRGREPYKYHWGAVDQPTFKRMLRRA